MRSDIDTFSSLSGDAIAKRYGLSYDGDASPIPHGGTFYSTENWESDGYAEAVRIDNAPDCGIVAERIVINRPDDMRDAFACLGMSASDNIHEQIAACLGYGHYDPDCSDWREVPTVVFLDSEHEHEQAAREATPIMFWPRPEYVRADCDAHDGVRIMWKRIARMLEAIS